MPLPQEEYRDRQLQVGAWAMLCVCKPSVQACFLRPCFTSFRMVMRAKEYSMTCCGSPCFTKPWSTVSVRLQSHRERLWCPSGRVGRVMVMELPREENGCHWLLLDPRPTGYFREEANFHPDVRHRVHVTQGGWSGLTCFVLLADSWQV